MARRRDHSVIAEEQHTGALKLFWIGGRCLGVVIGAVLLLATPRPTQAAQTPAPLKGLSIEQLMNLEITTLDRRVEPVGGTTAAVCIGMTTPLASMRYGTLARLTGATETVAAARGWAAGAFAHAKTASETNGAAKNAAQRDWRNPIICDGSTVIQGSAGWGAPNRYSAPNKPIKPIQLIVQYVQVP